MMKRLVCYAHFDGKGQVRPFVQHALQMIRPCCADLVFVSNSPITDQDQALLAASATHVIVNNNTGYDFYMWKLGLESVDLSLYDEVILMNSSVFGPLFAMEPVFSAMAAVACDFWGITECFQMQPHIQSYFLVFRKAMVRSEAFRLFWNSILPYTNKLQVIQSYEVGLTQWFVESGFRAGVYCSFEQIGLLCRNAGKRLRKKDNTSVKFALELLQAGSPFLKRDAVRNRKVDLKPVDQYLEEWGYPRRLIDDEFSEPAGAVCPLCAGSGKTACKGVQDYHNLHEAGRYDYMRCTTPSCGVVWRRSLSAVADSTVATTTLRLPATAGMSEAPGADLLSVLGTRPAGELLVIGVVDDRQLQGLHEAGWRISGALPADTLRESLDVPTGGAATAADRYDGILMMDGFEQTYQPGRLLEACHRVLKPQGTLVLVTPNSAALLLSIFRGYWSGFNAPRNLIIHNRSSIRSLLTAAGFEVAGIRTDSRKSDRYALYSLESLLNKWTSGSVDPRTGRRWLALLFRAYGAVLGLFLRGRGDECVAVAVKTAV
ncbi:methyltransferase domain-containing protein [Trichlorobacter lovleyi]|uniref:rhamnan synthesis F family protein n=1 Tax=Trichlorobacter lovleyi TaxID=313985 RepID=UPI00223ECACF|nr:rhamnan synthesis F family protein [Trichlorobacter lovleyi]QOX78007.1 methyltransferase domain-containing protein [Trichlorobacter lovleyi]